MPKTETVVFARQQITTKEATSDANATQSAQNTFKSIKILGATQKPTPTKKPTPVPPSPTNTPTQNINNNNSSSSISNELTSVVNSYRASNGKTNLQTHELLCNIAGKRVDELIARGGLDNHAGFGNYTGEIKQQFNGWWETIFYGSNFVSSSDVVNTHWNSSSGHKAALLSDATHGCGFVKSGYAVYVLGKK